MADTAPVAADDVTEEMIALLVETLSDWEEGDRIDWGHVLDIIDGAQLADGSILDLGGDMTTPAITKLKRRTLATLKEEA